ncbi:hypothetical protein ACVWZL_002962 [Bradyrhizobium sp. GM2.4]
MAVRWLHAAGQLSRIFLLVAGKTHQIEQIARPLARGLHRKTDDLCRQQHVVQDRPPFQQQRLLEHHANVAGRIERAFGVADLHRAAVGVVQAGQNLHHGGLAAAGRADQRDQLTLLHVHGDVGHRQEFGAAAAIDLADALQADKGA